MREAILEVLHTLESAYEQKPVDRVDALVKELFTEGAVYCGTSAEELRCGHREIAELLLNDWKFWGIPRLDYPKARVKTYQNADAATVFATGKLFWRIPSEKLLNKSVLDIRQILDRPIPNLEKIQQVNYLCSHIVLEQTRGDEHILPLRVSVSLHCPAGNWLIDHMTVSHPMETYPDSRYKTPESAEMY